MSCPPELREKLDALLDSVGDRKVLVDLIVDVVARGLGKLGGRPRSGETEGAPEPKVKTNGATNGHLKSEVVEVSEPVGKPQNLKSEVSEPVFHLKSEVRRVSKPVRNRLVNLKNEHTSALDPDGPDPDPDQQPACRLPPDFATFWAHYPRRVGKADALKAWKRRHPPLEQCLAALRWQVRSADWTAPNRDGRSSIPHPATWLNAERWTDERPAPPVDLNQPPRLA